MLLSGWEVPYLKGGLEAQMGVDAFSRQNSFFPRKPQFLLLRPFN